MATSKTELVNSIIESIGKLINRTALIKTSKGVKFNNNNNIKCYGNKLPSTGEEGQIFFLLPVEEKESQ